MKRFKNILYFAEGDTEATPALHRAVELAESNQARLTVIDVLEPVDTPYQLATRFDVDLDQMLRERRLGVLEGLVAPFRQPDSLIYSEVLSGTPFVEVIRAVQRRGHDLLLKAARPPAGLSEHLFGSGDMHLLRKCPCPVWIDRGTLTQGYGNVLAAVDPMADAGEGCDRLVMGLASSLAQRESARLEVVHAWRLAGESMIRHGRFHLPSWEVDGMVEQAEGRHRDRFADLLRRYGLAAEGPGARLIKGPPAAVIRQVAAELPADLIVMGTVGRVGIPGFFIGNTAEEVLQTTSASVLAVKPEGFVSPVS